MKVYNAGGDFPSLRARGTLNVPRVAPTTPTDGDLWIDSTANTLNFREDGATITVALSTGSLDAEQVRDIIGAALADSATLDTVYNDAGDLISFTVLDSPTVGGATAANLRDRSTHTGTQTSATISDFTEAAQDAVGGALADTSTLDLTYNDAANTISGVVLDSPTVGGSNKAFLLSTDNHTSGTTNKVFSATEQSKLSGIASGATANSTDAALRNTDTHTDGTTNRVYSATDKSKLAGIATGATANSSDATLLNRANHTGTQAPATIQMATARLLGRITAATGGAEELTNAQVKTLLAVVSTDISDFAAAAVAAINAAGNVDADTVGGMTAAQIQTAVTSAIVNGAQATLDTLNELAAAIGNDPNFATTMTTALGLRSRYFTAALPATALVGGVADAVITHNLNTKKINAQVWNTVTDWQEDAMVQATSVNTCTVRFEGAAIPATTYEVRIVTAA